MFSYERHQTPCLMSYDHEISFHTEYPRYTTILVEASIMTEVVSDTHCSLIKIKTFNFNGLPPGNLNTDNKTHLNLSTIIILCSEDMGYIKSN